MLITFGQLNTHHYGGDWEEAGGGGGAGGGDQDQPGVLAPLSHPGSCLSGPNWTLGVWSCTAGLQEIIFLS